MLLLEIAPNIVGVQNIQKELTAVQYDVKLILIAERILIDTLIQVAISIQLQIVQIIATREMKVT